MARKRIVVLCETSNPEWRWISAKLPEYDWEFVRAPGPTGTIANRIQRLGAAFRAALLGRHADLLITFGLGLGGALEIARSALRVRTRHACYFLNFDTLPTGSKRLRQTRACRNIDRFVVSATAEKALYSAHFAIDPERIDVILWGVSAPVASELRPVDVDYICAVGGNARDYDLFLEVARARPAMQFVLVARPANLAGLDVPGNVKALCNIPLADAMAVIANARIMALPLRATDTPCGHVTIVAAFYLGTPVVVTASTGIEDYVVDGETGLVTAQASADEMGQAVDRLWHDRTFADEITAAAKHFAQTQCTEENYPPHVRRLLAD